MTLSRFFCLQALLLILFLPRPAFAQDHPGEKLFIQTCKICHFSAGQGGALTPLSKSRLQWQRFFNKTRHSHLPQAWESIDTDDLQTILDYLTQHAADSDSPRSDSSLK